LLKLSSLNRGARVSLLANLASARLSLTTLLIVQYLAIIKEVATISCLRDDHIISAPVKN
jgi:hypothetical protein